MYQNYYTRNYYSRPAPPDIQYEERNQFWENSYDGHGVNEWNIDGKSEYEIINTLKNITTATTTYKIQSNDENKTANLIIAGFSGQLKGWWDYYVSDYEKTEIYQKIKPEIINGQLIHTQDIVNTLIEVITKQFIGNPSQIQERASEALLNHKCPTLTDFRWYKDVFLSRIFTRPDCNLAYWKEKFVAGLLTQFAEKVRNTLRNEFNGNIPWVELTYGQLINTINQEGLILCTDLRLKERIKNENRINQKELGTFCQQYGYEPIQKAPSKRKKKMKINPSFKMPRKSIKNNSTQ